jgi:hypothetical protein
MSVMNLLAASIPRRIRKLCDKQGNRLNYWIDPTVVAKEDRAISSTLGHKFNYF